MPTRKPTPKRTKTRSRSNVAPAGTIKASWRKLSGIQLTAVVALVVGLGVFVVWSVFAGTIINNEPESFTVSSSAGIATRNDPTAANGQYLEFLAPSAPSTPPPTTANCPAGTTAMPVKAAEAQFKGKWPNSGNDYNDSTNKNAAGVSMATGVPAGTCLTKYSGFYYANQAGKVYEGLDVQGCIIVTADNVTIRNSRVTSDGTCRYQVINNGGVVNLNIVQVEANGSNRTQACLTYSYYTAKNANVYGCEDALKAGTNTTVQDSYIHGPWETCDPPYDIKTNYNPYSCTHNDGVQITKGNKLRFTGNNFEYPGLHITSAVMIGNDDSCKLKTDPEYGVTTDVIVSNNRINGGGYQLYGGDAEPGKCYTPASNVTITNNTFGPNYGAPGVTGGHFTGLIPSVVWSGNKIESTGQILNR